MAVSIDPAIAIDPATGQDRGQIAFAASLGIDFPMIPDTGRNVTVLYNDLRPDTLAERMSVLIDKDGIVRLIDKSVNVRTHGPDILARMRELGLAKPEPAPVAQPTNQIGPIIITPTVPTVTTGSAPPSAP
ncbi:MAG: hypothetical protein M3347_01930 [Armatimonadota bacterium]|nr:hypothetical protein [Armatimonadota bacterium]